MPTLAKTKPVPAKTAPPITVVFAIRYPNGKRFIASDKTNSINYFGSADSAVIAADFSAAERLSFTITREILWQAENPAPAEVRQKLHEFIEKFKTTDPAKGYNRRDAVQATPGSAAKSAAPGRKNQ